MLLHTLANPSAPAIQAIGLAAGQGSGEASYGAWLSVAVVGCLAFAVVGGALLAVRIVTRVLDRIRPTSERLSTYECGEEPVGSAWFRFNNRFTTVALAFLVFDAELALLWPILPRCVDWLGAGRGTLVFLEVAAFAGTLAVGLFWVAAAGGFVWDRSGLMRAPATEREENVHG